MIYKILRQNNRNMGTIYAEMDANIIAVCNALLKFASPDLTLKGYADANNEPDNPAENDCYLVLSDGTYWEVAAAQYDFIMWDGSAWAKETFKLTELNTAFQALFFDAENIGINPVHGLTAGNVQEALEELAAAHFGSGSTSV